MSMMFFALCGASVVLTAVSEPGWLFAMVLSAAGAVGAKVYEERK